MNSSSSSGGYQTVMNLNYYNHIDRHNKYSIPVFKNVNCQIKEENNNEMDMPTKMRKKADSFEDSTD